LQPFDETLGRGRSPPAEIDASMLDQFFDDKVDGVREAMSGATLPVFTAVPAGCQFRTFTPITEADAIELVKSSPDKQCSSDSTPAWLLMADVDILSPFPSRLFCKSLECGDVLSVLKSAYITPILKKVDLDPADPKSYQPISNLSIVSKMVKKIVSKQLVRYLMDHGQLPHLQLAYKAHHSTETVVLKVLSDILLAPDTADVGVLMLLDLSAAFYSVDHITLLQRQKTSYGMDGML
jgi:Reverse transcriptase (RNA-dependent DNA polymerase)